MLEESLIDYLIDIDKPGRYLGGEINSVDPQYKLSLESESCGVLVRVCIAFPDVYEVGMSHLGIHLIYQILNSRADCLAERCFMPYPDLEEKLRMTSPASLENIPNRLWSLESKTELANFDVIGFSLQYELCGTNILSMLELGGVAFYSKDRSAYDPLVIGGGPVSFQPEPLAPFFDAFLLGDGEEAVQEIITAVKLSNKLRTIDLAPQEAKAHRLLLLQALHKIPGVYVPQLYEPRYNEDNKLLDIDRPIDKPVVKKRIVSDLSTQPQLDRPIVSLLDIVHDRLGLEVMRGCVRGCRFCQAGYIYRPQRERSPEELLSNMKLALENTGFEQVSLLSLSTADYCSIVPLLKMISHDYATQELEVSFPSTRVDALTIELLNQVPPKQRQRFTLAPEGGSQRLRDVINKCLSDEQIIETINNVFSLGWKGVKLYFMIGLPTETYEDLDEIVNLLKRMKSLPSYKGKEITVNASTFVPKAHTPFQWVQQIGPEETIRRQRYLASCLRQIRIGYRFHDPFSTLLEGIFSRGSRKLSTLWHRAYSNGCRLDGSPEYLNREAWEKTFAEEGVDPLTLLQERSLNDVMPWSHLSTGITDEFFLREYSRALNQRITHSCLNGRCSLCHVCDSSTGCEEPQAVHNVFRGTTLSESDMRILERKSLPTTRELRIRFAYSKLGKMRVIGHFETSRAITRAMKRAKLPLLLSQGFSPMPKISFGPPLQLGVASRSEYFDAIFTSDVLNSALFSESEVGYSSLIEAINSNLPSDLKVVSAEKIPFENVSIQESVEGYGYSVIFRKRIEDLLTAGLLGCALSTSFDGKNYALGYASALLNRDLTRCEIAAKRKAGDNNQKTLILGDFVTNLCLAKVGHSVKSVESICENGSRLELTFDSSCPQGKKSPRPLDVMFAISGMGLTEYDLFKIATYVNRSLV